MAAALKTYIRGEQKVYRKVGIEFVIIISVIYYKAVKLILDLILFNY